MFSFCGQSEVGNLLCKYNTKIIVGVHAWYEMCFWYFADISYIHEGEKKIRPQELLWLVYSNLALTEKS